ncbi:MAG: CoA-transferase [Burkholderiaceae bacterium]
MSANVAELQSHELLAFTIAGLLRGLRQVAVGASSPIPGSGALLARLLAERAGERPLRLQILGSRAHNTFTNGGVEIFDMIGTGRIDAFFLGGGQLDGQANINLVGIGDYPTHSVRWPGSFGSAYLYHLVPHVILFREEHSRRVLVPRVDFVSAAGPRPDAGHHRPGGPYGLLTNRCFFRFDRDKARFRLVSLHPGHTLEEIRDETGFEFDIDPMLGPTAVPDPETLALLRGPVLDQIAETYPKFAEMARAAVAA